MVAYLDAAQEHIDDRADARHEAMVEGVRLGTVFAHDSNAYSRWRHRARRHLSRGASGGGGLVGQALEAAVLGIAARNPEYVVFGGA